MDVVDRLTEQTADQIGNLTEAQTEAQAETSAQITRLISAQIEILERISAQAEISATRNVPGHPEVPSEDGLDEVADDIRSPRHDTMGRV